MALTASTVGPYFASGSISFSQLRTNFKETSSGEVKASELLRVTDITNTDPIVPDATENSNIATSTNLKASQFRNSIKYYNLNQGSSDTDVNLNIAASSLWNGNLGKTIVKTVTLAGTSGSSSTSTPAASLDASSVYNVLLIITGSVLGDGGSGGLLGGNGGPGGDALYINTNSSGTVTVRTSGASAQVYGGGGGGGGGGRGGKGGTGSYTTYETYYTSVGGQGGTYGGSYDSRCRQSCERSGASWVNNCYKHTSEGGANCGGNTSHYDNGVCYSDDASSYASVTACKKTNTRSISNTSSGGNGGEEVGGGNGRGYLQSRSNGAEYNEGINGGTNAGKGGNSGSGGNGGDWGEGGSDYNGGNGVKGSDGTNDAPDFGEENGPITGGLGGAAGRSISGSGYVIDTANGVDSAYKGIK